MLTLAAFVLPATASAAGPRAALAQRLGAQAVVDVDPSTGTPRVLARLDGTLTGPSSRTPEAIADAYVRANLGALGLTAADLDTLGPAAVTTGPGGIAEVRRRQAYRGIPSSDSELRVNVTGDGRVLDVLGSPAHALAVDSIAPALGAGEALRAVQADVGAFRSEPRRSGPAGAARTTTYPDGSSASLELFHRGEAVQLVWRVTYHAAPDAVYDAVVDAQTGAILRRVNMVESDAIGSVWDRFPDGGAGGTRHNVDFEALGWLAAAAPALKGPNVWAWSDLDDSLPDSPGPGEEIGRAGGSFVYPFLTNSGAACDPQHVCSWDGTSATRTQNRAQNGVQAFYLANRFHDHLAAPPIGFTTRAFEGNDPLLLETEDGASTGPDVDHINNANMFTPRDGESPVMQMYLFSGSYRNVNGGDDASILFHEYTHGLSNRLVVDATGAGALSSAQAGAMGEAWSDWYAQDFLATQFGGIRPDMGAYTDVPGGERIRTQPLDCPVVAADPIKCPGTPALGSGGYTYADFGAIIGRPEVHADGEIWGETLWDLRTALGSSLAEELVTEGMRLSPPEPSFLDERNAILQADAGLHGGAHRAQLWTIFAQRGMGYFAGTLDGTDVTPTADSSLPPDPNGPKGTIAGTVTSSDTGAGLGGVTVGVAGLENGPDAHVATTDASGRYTITGVPEADYPRLLFARSGWDTVARPAQVLGGATATRDAVLRRDWAAAKGGATVTLSNHQEYANLGCGPAAAIDQSSRTGWSADDAGPTPQMVVTLPAVTDVAWIGLDPGETCGDGPSAATSRASVETATNASCTNWAIAVDQTFGSSQAGGLIEFPSRPGTAAGVRCVRLKLLAGSGGGFIDLSELAVYSSAAPTQPQLVDPTPTPVATVSPAPVPTAVPTPPPPAEPSFTLLSGGKGRATFTVRCAAACRVTAALGVDARTARRLRLKTLGTKTAALPPGVAKVTVMLSLKARRAMSRHRLKSVTATMKVTARYGTDAPATATKRIRIRL